jgi:hypothetical protein
MNKILAYNKDLKLYVAICRERPEQRIAYDHNAKAFLDKPDTPKPQTNGSSQKVNDTSPVKPATPRVGINNAPNNKPKTLFD